MCLGCVADYYRREIIYTQNSSSMEKAHICYLLMDRNMRVIIIETRLLSPHVSIRMFL
jgi:hypothetical protein